MGSEIDLQRYAERFFKKKDIHDIFAQTVCFVQGVMLAIDVMCKEIHLKGQDESLRLIDVERMMSNLKSSIH